MDENNALYEKLIASWIHLTGVLKNTRITQDMIYNEAIVMNIVHRHYVQDGVGLVSFKQIVSETGMLKSLVNRTIESLVRKGALERSDGQDKRTTFIRPLNMDEYLAEHEKTLAMVDRIVQEIGVEDAEAFIRLADKIVALDPLLTHRPA